MIIVDKNKSVSHSTSQSATGTGTGVGVIGSIGLAVLVPTDYCGTVIYESGQLKRILTPEGYLTLNGLATQQIDPRDIRITDAREEMIAAVSEVEKVSEEGGRTVVIPVAGDTESGKIIAPSQGPKFRYNYFVNDYLGNVRAVLTWNKDGLTTTNYTVSQKNDYYAFGLPTSTSLNPEAQPYKREGKEYDEMHGWNMYDQGARFFGAALPITLVPDPLAEKYYSISPYAQWGNNPIRYVDTDGEDWKDVIKGFFHGTLGHQSNKGYVDQTYTTTIAQPIKDNSPRTRGNSDYETGYKAGEITMVVAEVVLGAVIGVEGIVTKAGTSTLKKGAEKAGKEILEEGAKRTVKEGVESGVEKVTKSYSEKTFNAFEKQLKEHGVKSIEKSRYRIERRLNEHKQKLKEINKNGGQGSSVEREIRTFEKQLKAIDDLLNQSK